MTPGAWTAIAVIAVLGLVLLCCVPVTIVGGYLAFRENARGPGLPININKVTRENFNRITDGMTPAQVEEILGRGQPVAGQQDLLSGVRAALPFALAS